MVGLVLNKFLVKLVLDLEKLCGFLVIGVVEVVEWLVGLFVGKIWGVGKVF